MAQTSSGALPVGSSYPLGEYSFRLTANYDSRQNVTHVTARCTKGEETASRSLSVPGHVTSWSVEADESEASVYVKTDSQRLDTGDVPVPVPTSSTMFDGPYVYGTETLTATWTVNGGVGVGEIVGSTRKYHLMASENAGATWSWVDSKGGTGSGSISNSFTYQGNTVYYHLSTGSTFKSVSSVTPSTTGDLAGHAGAVAWTMIYGVPSVSGSDEKLVGRFAIDLADAGGGPGGDWDEPGDDGDPFKTLHLTVTGAHSGRHNDPMGDTSYSYLPADKLTKAGYGCGGDGGHGGGGGAGASTVIIHKFATSRADSKDLTALARGHGYGSGGGKGGKGGDGIILIYYRETTP